MKRRLVARVLLVAEALLLLVAAVAAGRPTGEDERRLDLESFDVVWTTIRERHFDPSLGGLDWDAVRAELRPMVAGAATRQEALGVLRELVSRLGHSHVQIIPREVLAALGRGGGRGPLGGEVGLDARVSGGRALVISVAPGSPAAVAGVRPGWELVAVDGEPLREPIAAVATEFAGRSWRDAYVAAAVKGRLAGGVGEGVELRLVDGAGVVREVALARVEPRGSRYSFGFIEGLPVWIEASTLANGAGYVAFSSFLDPVHLMPVFNDAMESFREAPGVVLDLRGNEGGIGAMVAGMAGWFVEETGHSLGTMRLRDTELRFMVFPRPEPYSGPVAILIDELSCSGAEVLADGLRGLGRARLFGRRSAGMVLASQFEELPNGDALQYVFADYTSAKGGRLENVGVIPDVEIGLSQETLLAGRDAPLEAALAWIGKSNAGQAAVAGDPSTGRTQ